MRNLFLMAVLAAVFTVGYTTVGQAKEPTTQPLNDKTALEGPRGGRGYYGPRGGGWRGGYGPRYYGPRWGGGWYGGGVSYYSGPRVVYAQPQVVYAQPTVVYAAPPVVTGSCGTVVY